MITFLILIILLGFIVYNFLQHPKFGKAPSGERFTLIQNSPQYKNGKFENQSFTPDLAEGASMAGVLLEFFFKKVERKIPTDLIPSVKTNLHVLPIDQDVLVWFGHSSYFIQLEGKRFFNRPCF
ncbi:hypothetical protein AAFH68_40140 [Flavobacterium sp. CGRL1]